MQFLKSLGFLILLVSGYSGNAYTPLHLTDLIDQEQISSEVSEDLQELFESTLTTGNFAQSAQILIVPFPNFSNQSLYTTRTANIYINFSRTIDPALDVINIIFPFHSFL